MRLLVRREHSVVELTQKLSAKGFEPADIDASIAKLIAQNQQSDARFAADFIQMRVNQGKGSVKISAELTQRGIAQFDLSEYDFYALARQIRQRKFGCDVPSDFKQQAKQKRFLQSRGFSFDHINASFE